MSEIESGDWIAERFFQSLVRTLIASGDIDVEGKSAVEVRRIAEEYYVQHADEIEIDIVLTHEEDLLTEARRQVEADKLDFAIVFYATWIEHSLNGVLSHFARSADLSRGEYESVVRNSMADKTGVVWKLMAGEQFPVSFRTAILEISDARNSFVHYKWRPVIDSEYDAVRESKQALIEKAESLVGQLREYEERLLWRGNEEVAAWVHETDIERSA